MPGAYRAMVRVNHSRSTDVMMPDTVCIVFRTGEIPADVVGTLSTAYITGLLMQENGQHRQGQPDRELFGTDSIRDQPYTALCMDS